MNIETANRLLQYRKENNLSQEELAEKIGVSRQAVSKWERAEASPDTDNLIRLAEIYGVSLDEMLTGKKTQAEPEPEPQPEPQTDESNTGSFEPDPDTNYTQYDKVSFKKGIHVESKDGDKVHISFKDGVNVYEKHGDKVHVGWDGVNVNEKGKTRVYTDENGHVMVDDEIKNAHRTNSHYRVLTRFPFWAIALAGLFRNLRRLGIRLDRVFHHSDLLLHLRPDQKREIKNKPQSDDCGFRFRVINQR